MSKNYTLAIGSTYATLKAVFRSGVAYSRDALGDHADAKDEKGSPFWVETDQEPEAPVAHTAITTEHAPVATSNNAGDLSVADLKTSDTSDTATGDEAAQAPAAAPADKPAAKAASKTLTIGGKKADGAAPAADTVVI
jgi:hypothetical protein